jgi:4-hydroxy-tetrahydrodipicolinate reductase
MTIRVLVSGALGKMGQETVQALQQDPRFSFVGGITRGDDLTMAIQHSHPDVVVDFSNAVSVFENCKIILAEKVRPVIGTSGLLPGQIALLQQMAQEEKIGGVIAPNFSLGAILMMKYATEWVKYFPHVEIVEMHHDAKLDAPSGTALRTAQKLAQLRDKEIPNRPEKILVEGARGAVVDDIHIHSVRLPGLVAYQEIIFGGQDETLTVRHNSIHRRSYMPGVLLACDKVMTMSHLIYGLEQII